MWRTLDFFLARKIFLHVIGHRQTAGRHVRHRRRRVYMTFPHFPAHHRPRRGGGGGGAGSFSLPPLSPPPLPPLSMIPAPPSRGVRDEPHAHTTLVTVFTTTRRWRFLPRYTPWKKPPALDRFSSAPPELSANDLNGYWCKRVSNNEGWVYSFLQFFPVFFIRFLVNREIYWFYNDVVFFLFFYTGTFFFST